MTGMTAELAAFVAATTYDDLPPAVVQAVKWVVLDTLAVTIAGLGEAGPQILADVVRSAGGRPAATAWGFGFRTDPASAALLNATSVHAIDYDDYSFAMSGHPSAVLLPPVLALGEDAGLAGRDLIRAYAVGFEVAIMVSRTVNPDHYVHGWHPTGTLGAIGAACAAASLLGLDEDQVRNAIAVAVSSGAGLRQNFGTDIKPYHAGNAARSGVMAAQLAARGFAGHPATLEGPWGFFHVFTPERKERARPEGGLGHPWATLDPGITTKLFPACGSTHSAIGGLLDLRERGLRADDVEHLTVGVTDIAYANLQYPVPTTALEGKFSMSYCAARTLVEGRLTIDHFSDAAVNDPALSDLVRRIDCHHDQALTDAYVWGDHRPAVLTARLRSGEVLTHRRDAPPGAPGHLPRATLLDKVRDCVGRGAIRASADELVATVDGLEELDDLRALGALMMAA